jgi:hypothetical protein
MKKAEITITLNVETGQCNVTGPIHDKIFCYGLLELGRDLIRAYVPPKVQIANPGVMTELAKQLGGKNGQPR